MKEKEVIRLRKKSTSKQGQESLYLDYYYKGKRQYEFLRLYLIPEQTKADKIKNEETLRLANAIKAKRIIEFFNDIHGFETAKPDVNLIQYIECVGENKHKIGKTGVPLALQTLVYHLKKYKGNKILLQDVDVKYLNGFVRYLSTAISVNSGKQVLKQSTQHNIFASLKMIIHQAIKDELLSTDPSKSVDSPKTIPSHKEFLTEQELKTLITTDCRNEFVKRSFLFCCFTGLRISDVRSLSWGQITTNSDTKLQINFRQKKTRLENYIPLSDNAISQLPQQQLQSITDEVFKLPSESAIRNALKEWMLKAKVNKHITFHCSRHTCAILLLNRNVEIYTVKEILGHTDIKTTMQYAKVVGKTKQKAVNSIPNLY